MENQLTQSVYFGSGVYTVKAPQFLEAVRTVSTEALALSPPPKKNKIYPSVMTIPYGNDPRIADFAAGAPLLMIGLARPTLYEWRPGWPGECGAPTTMPGSCGRS